MRGWFFLAAFFTNAAWAQMMPMGDVCRPEGRSVQALNLSEAQQKQITSICKDSFKKVFELRNTVRKAEDDLQGAFDESPVNEARSSAAIEHLNAARSDLFRATSQMDLKIRTVLTDDQWQELKRRQHRFPGGRPGGSDWRRGGPPPKGAPTIGQPQKNN